MPLYEFDCATCGPFDAWRAMAESGQPMDCPRCGAAATRRFSPPALGLPGPITRRRMEQAKQPRLVSHQAPEERPGKTRPRAVAGRPWQISG